jgi:hypothetical protein
MRDYSEIAAELDQLLGGKRRLESELLELKTRSGDSGVDERISNIQRGLEQRSLKEAELRGEWGEAIADGLASSRFTTESGHDDIWPRSATPPTGRPSASGPCTAPRASSG